MTRHFAFRHAAGFAFNAAMPAERQPLRLRQPAAIKIFIQDDAERRAIFVVK